MDRRVVKGRRELGRALSRPASHGVGLLQAPRGDGVVEATALDSPLPSETVAIESYQFCGLRGIEASPGAPTDARHDPCETQT